MTKRKRRVYSEQFKSDAVKLVTQGGKTFGQVSKEFELTESALRDWVKAAQLARPLDAAAPLTTSERAELVDLRKRLKRAEMERDILKKATAFFARESE